MKALLIISLIKLLISLENDEIPRDNKTNTQIIVTNTKFNKTSSDYKHIFIEAQILFENYSQEKTNLRSLRPAQYWDKTERLLGDVYVKNILLLPTSGSGIKPWSGHYWNARYGYTSVRYTGDDHDTQYYSEVRGRYIYSFLTYTFFQSISKYSQPAEHNKYSKMDNYSDYVNAYYSPSEKYDLLVGDYDFTLTNVMKKEGRQFVHSGGDVNEWCGICHGWAVAAYWEQRPVKPVWVKGVDGTLIQFLPDDIKGLISQYWGFVKYDNHMLGYRCNYFDISVLPSDPGTGLTLDYPCFGMNPATFHLAVTNYMGLQGRNFVFEPMVDAEVWNHPVWKYKTVYYNPITLAEGSVNNSIVTIDDARRNLTYFLSFLLKNKSSDSVYLIGVKTTMYYIGEIKPDHKNKYIPDDEKNKTFSYVLELDGDRNILQGEWISNDHPNWILTPKVDASTPEDDQIPMWLGSPDYLASIKEYIIRQSNNKIPLKAIIRYLIQNSAN